MRWPRGPWRARRIIRLAVAAGLLLMCYHCARMPRPPIRGYVRDGQTGLPVAGALVTVEGHYGMVDVPYSLLLGPTGAGGGWGHAYTDKDGYFAIPSRSCTWFRPIRTSDASYGVPNYRYIFMPKWFEGITLEVLAPDYQFGRAESGGKRTDISASLSRWPFVGYRCEIALAKASTCEDWTDRYRAFVRILDYYDTPQYPYPDDYGVCPLLRRAYGMHDFTGILATCLARPKNLQKPVRKDEGGESFGWAELGRVSVKKGLEGPVAYATVASDYWTLWEARREPDAARWRALFSDAQAALRRCQAQGDALGRQLDAGPDAAMWIWGCERQDILKEMMDHMHEPVRFVESRGKPVVVNGQQACRNPDDAGIRQAFGTPLLILPTGSLVETDQNRRLKRALTEYVEQGGTLLCFGQFHGRDWQSLPAPTGDELVAKGTEEVHARFKEAGVVATEHPILSLAQGTRFNVLMDGRFVKVPKASQVLLRTDDFPTMVIYPMGKGWVVATASYEDKISMYNSKYPSPEMKTIVANAVAWAKAPGRPVPITRVTRGQDADSVPLTLELRNLSDADAERVEICAWAPFRAKVAARATVALRVPAHSQVSLPVSLNLSECASSADFVPGIYQCDYRLMKTEAWGEREVQPWAETDNGRFALERLLQGGSGHP